MPSHWLVKSEPSVYSIDDLQKERSTLWGGVRNYQARNFLRDGFKRGDLVLFYHSSEEPVGVAGVAKVEKVGIPDPLQFDEESEYFDPKATKRDPLWWAPRLKFSAKFPKMVGLNELRKEKKLKSMLLLKRGTRLSVQPVSASEYQRIIELGCSEAK